MAISRGNGVLHSDINAIFSAFNTLINSQSWGINAIPAADIPAQGSKVDDANITVELLHEDGTTTETLVEKEE